MISIANSGVHESYHTISRFAAFLVSDFRTGLPFGKSGLSGSGRRAWQFVRGKDRCTAKSLECSEPEYGSLIAYCGWLDSSSLKFSSSFSTFENIPGLDCGGPARGLLLRGQSRRGTAGTAPREALALAPLSSPSRARGRLSHTKVVL